MKINGNSIAGKIQEAAEAVTSKATEAKEKIASENEKAVVNAEISVAASKDRFDQARSAAQDKKDSLRLAADTSRAELEAKLQPGGSTAGNVLYGAREGFDAGKKSGEQAHADTNATGPKFIAGMAGGIVGGISGAIDGYSVGNSGGSAEDIRKEARANADYSGGIAGGHAMFLDESSDERTNYPRYKAYQAAGGKMSYSDWHAEYGGGHGSGGSGSISAKEGEHKEQPVPEQSTSETTTTPTGDGNDEAWNQLAEYSGANNSEYVQDANSSEDPLTQLGNYSRDGHNN